MPLLFWRCAIITFHPKKKKKKSLLLLFKQISRSSVLNKPHPNLSSATKCVLPSKHMRTHFPPPNKSYGRTWKRFSFFFTIKQYMKKEGKNKGDKKKTKKIKVEETKERSKKRILFEWSRSSGRGRQVSIQWGRRAPDTLHVCPYFLGPL